MKKVLAFLLIAVTGFVFAQGTYNVTFKANMKVAAKKALFTPSTDKVVVRGSFNGWAGDTDELTDGTPADSIYSLTKSITRKNVGKADTISFKFVRRSGSTEDWEDDPNRTLIIPANATDITLSGWFKNDSIYKPTKAIAVTFQCNMEYELGSGRFNPPADSLSVNGSFNGWSSKKDILSASQLNPNLYKSKAVSINAAEGDSIQYKFWYEPGTWEGVSNRVYKFKAADITSGAVTIPAVYFNNGTLTDMTASPCTITFTVNCSKAISASGTSFQSIKKVVICGSAKPLNWPQSGWPTSDSALVNKMYDDGTHGDKTAGDKIFTTQLTFPKFTTLRQEYKYSINFGLTDNGGANDNENSVGGNHILKFTSPMLSATTVDTFGNAGHTSVLTNVVTNGVEVVNNLKPSVYTLSQNYPNPFNPSTNIKFAIPNSGMTTLKVYNVLGQEVATLVNESLSAGSYVANFSAANLSSGIYIYELRSNNFRMTKKMTLMK